MTTGYESPPLDGLNLLDSVKSSALRKSKSFTNFVNKYQPSEIKLMPKQNIHPRSEVAPLKIVLPFSFQLKAGSYTQKHNYPAKELPALFERNPKLVKTQLPEETLKLITENKDKFRELLSSLGVEEIPGKEHFELVKDSTLRLNDLQIFFNKETLDLSIAIYCYAEDAFYHLLDDSAREAHDSFYSQHDKSYLLENFYASLESLLEIFGRCVERKLATDNSLLGRFTPIIVNSLNEKREKLCLDYDLCKKYNHEYGQSELSIQEDAKPRKLKKNKELAEAFALYRDFLGDKEIPNRPSPDAI